MVRNRCNEEEQPDTGKPINVFRNDGSFLEMFKKLQETGGDGGSQPASSSTSAPTTSSAETDCVDGNVQSNQCTDNTDKKTTSELKPGSSRPPQPLTGIVGKRRGGRVLPTGKVKKTRVEPVEEEVKPHKDAWSLYMAEVKRYKQSTCEEEGKTRPLVK